MEKYQKIKSILMSWNPLSVTGPALSDEYNGLIPNILNKKSESEIDAYLKETLSTKYGIEFKELSCEYKLEFESIIKQIVYVVIC